MLKVVKIQSIPSVSISNEDYEMTKTLHLATLCTWDEKLSSPVLLLVESQSFSLFRDDEMGWPHQLQNDKQKALRDNQTFSTDKSEESD